MSEDLIIQLISNFIFMTIALIVVYWKSYTSEKGKNLATKKDIEEITKKIEVVKNEIGIHSQRRLEYLNDKKKTALDFLGSVSVWLDFTLKPLDRLCNNPYNSGLLSDIILEIKDKGSKATSDYWKIGVYFDNDAFNKVVDELFDCCIELHNMTNQFVINIERNAVIRNNLNDIYQDKIDKDYAEKLREKIDRIDNETTELVNLYTKDSEVLRDKTVISRYKYILTLNKILKIGTNTPSIQKT